MEVARLRRQVRQLQMERNILAKATGLVRRQERVLFEVVNANQAHFRCATVSRVENLGAGPNQLWVADMTYGCT